MCETLQVRAWIFHKSQVDQSLDSNIRTRSQADAQKSGETGMGSCFRFLFRL
jgi:hypothetical protein